MTEETQSYLCPRCQLPLTRVQTSQGIFWACTGCGGRALTVELLRRTFKPESINPLWRHAISDPQQSGSLPCPSCRRTMINVALSETATVRVDVCKLCHFVWFDAHETETLVPLPPPPKPIPLPPKAREATAMLKVEALAEAARGTDADSAPPDEWWQEIAGYFGMPVEYDAPPLERRPWVTWSLCLVIIAVSVSAFSNLHELVQRFGLIPAEATRLGGLTFITSFFLHVGFIHLLGNMYFLFVFGDDVENFLGRARYLFLIFFAAIIGGIAHLAAGPASQQPCVGASGGIAAVITFYALAFPEVKLGFLLRWGFYWFRWIRLPAWFVLVLWIAFQLIGAWEQVAGVSAVSSFAHLGGALTGLASWMVWRKRGCHPAASA